MSQTSKSVYGVVPHCDRQQQTGRGYVVREYANGQFVDHYNYGGQYPIRLFVRKIDAERYADGQYVPTGWELGGQ